MKSFSAGSGPLPTALEGLLSEQVLVLSDRLLDLLPLGVYICDGQGRVVRYNRAAAQLWGRAPERGDPSSCFCGAYRLRRLDGRPLLHANSPMARALESGRGVSDQEIIVERPDGSRIIVVANIEVIKDEAGRVVGAVNLFRDVTEERRRQQRHEARQGATDNLLQALPAAVYTTDAEGRLTFYNEAAAALWGCRPTLGEASFCGSWKLYCTDGAPMRHDECPMAVALKEGRPIRGREAVAERPDGSRVTFLAFPTPLFDGAGLLTGAVNMLLEVDGRKESDLAAQRLAAIVESSDDAIWAKDLDGTIMSWNAGAERLLGYSAGEVIGRPVTLLVPAERPDEEPAILARIHRGERIEHYETIRRRKDGGMIDVSLTVSPIRNALGQTVGASTIARDISEQRRAEERQQLLLREMNHRIKNLFMLAGNVVTLSARSAGTPAELARSVQERLGALARAHALTLPDSIKRAGAEQATTLHALLATIVAPYEQVDETSETRVQISGADLALSGSTVTSLALLLHEFTTNAAKYGALASPDGRIEIACAEEGERFLLHWRERGGPPVVPVERAQGFGSLLAEATVKGHLGGEIRRDWAPEGLSIVLSVPRDRLGA